MANYVSIYKLDKEKIDINLYNELAEGSLELDTASNVPGKTYVDAIVYLHNYHIDLYDSQAKKFRPTKEGATQAIQNTTFYFYHADNDDNKPHPWNNAFSESLSLENTVFENVAAFYMVDGEIFALNSGHATGLFAQYIDDEFPLNVAQRIMNSNPTGANEKIVIGNVFGRLQTFRSGQVISASRNINSVWQGLEGKITDEVKNETQFEDLFLRKTKDASGEFSSFVLIKKSIEFDKLPEYTRWLIDKSKEDLSEEREKAFDYLRSLRRVRQREDRQKLDAAYIAYLLDIVQNGKDASSIEFSHKDYIKLKTADNFEIKAGDRKVTLRSEELFSTANVSLEVLKTMMGAAGSIFDELDEEGQADYLRTQVSISPKVNGDFVDISPKQFMYFFHGEFDYAGQKYYRIDANWYMVTDNFLEVVKNEFASLLRNEVMTDVDNLGIRKYIPDPNKKDEGKYNRGYDDDDECIVADKVKIDQVELADVIRFTNGGVTIYHNKIGFGASIRDVCSQLSLSMSMIDRILSTGEDGRAILAKYYDMMSNKYQPDGEYKDLTLKYTKNDFIDKMVNTPADNYTFVLGCMDSKVISEERRSSIAKFELVGIANTEAAQYKFRFRIASIVEEDN